MAMSTPLATSGKAMKALGAPVKAMYNTMTKGDRNLFSSSDDSAVMRQIQATHAPDGREVDVRPLLRIVEDILQRAKPNLVVTPQQHMEVMENDSRFPHNGLSAMLEALAYTIHKISAEIAYRCSGGSGDDAHGTTLTLFHLLSSYSWDSKVVLALAAFAVSYGEFWLTAQLQTVNPLAKSVALLKQLPDILAHANALKPRFDALNALIAAILEVTWCIVEFTDLPSEYITQDTADMSMAVAHVPTAVYWTIRSIIACAGQMTSLIGLGHEYISATTEAWELSSLAHKLRNIHGHLQKQLQLCQQHIDDKRRIEAYNTLVRLFDAIHIDNQKILRALIYSKDNHPLVDPATRNRVGLDVLRRKIVILFISDLDIPQEDLFILIQLYNDANQGKVERNYEIVWLPIIDRHQPWTPARDEAFNRLAASMPWYVLHHPSVVDPAVIKYVRDVWHFDKKPLLVVLDPQGKVACRNAMHMMWIWGSLAYPFTSNREEALWKEETWRLEFLVDEIDPTILTWIREGRYVCLYGGEDIDWIRRFTTTLRRVAENARIPLEMVYVGRSNPKERVKKAVAVIENERLSGYWPDPTMMWFFWVRLESMWHSKMQHGRSVEDDAIMSEVMTLLSLDVGNEGWAIISRGAMELVKAHGKQMLDCLATYDAWKQNVEHQGFIPALAEALQPFHTAEHCTRLILPGDTGTMEERVVCAECKKPMERYVLYRCCNT